jgi:hypothetical protein
MSWLTYGIDLDPGIRLTMTLLLADVLLRLILEHHNFIALGLFNDLCLSANAFNYGLADSHVLAVAKHQNLKANLSTSLGIELFDQNLIARLDLVLLATGTDNSVHLLHLLFPNLACDTAPLFTRFKKAVAERLTKAL